MQTQGYEIRIYDVCLEYYRLVDKFYFWLYRELKKHHQKDLEERKKWTISHKHYKNIQ